MAKQTKKQLDKKNLHTVSLLVANKPGVLVRIALVFARRGFNIDSLVVSPSVDQRFSRMTITAQGDIATLDQIIKQTSKLVDAIHVSEHTPCDAIAVEMALFKIRTRSSTKSAIQKLLRHFHARISQKASDTLIIEVTGETLHIDEFEKKIKKFGIIEMVRSGKLVMTRGKVQT